MTITDLEPLQGGKFKRKTKRKLGLFIDGAGLDRATRRLNRKVDLARFVAGITEGRNPEIARYYTLVPYEDDARQLSFLEAVERAGLEVVLKRLPPKGVKRPVSMDVHMAVDMLSFSLGRRVGEQTGDETTDDMAEQKGFVRQIVTVCPNRELSYALFSCNALGAQTTLADFGLYGSSDGWRGIDRWIDLSTSETIWRD